MWGGLKPIPAFFLRPLSIVGGYSREQLGPDLAAGLTVAVILLPQGIAYALIAELPPEMGLYAAIVAAIVGALWGSSNHLHTGPTNAASLLVLSILLPIFPLTASREYVAAAGLLAVMVGAFRLLMGLARLGMLVNFVSDSVIVGFTAGAGILISVNQLNHLLRLDIPSSPGLIPTLEDIFYHLRETHWSSLVLGLGTIALIALLRRVNPKLPAPLLGMVAASMMVWLLGLERQGVAVIGQLPRSLPPLVELPLLDLELIGQVSTGALAIAAIGLVEAMSIARAIASQTNQRLDSNQEFVGQGLANIACGFLSGYTTSGSFTRSAVNYQANGQTPLASVFSGLFVLAAMLALAPLAAYVPRTALAGVLIVTAYGMVDRREMVRIWRGARGDALIMVVTLVATLFLPLQFSVLTGILASLAYYITQTSTPRVRVVVPDDDFNHLAPALDKPSCPQLGIIEILGDLYFGAVSHVEEAIYTNMEQNPGQRFLMLRMHNVNHCDISGIHMLEAVRRSYRERGGDLFLMQVRHPVYLTMQSTGFYGSLGEDHFLSHDRNITYLFHHILDPASCIYECEVRVFRECQNLPKRSYSQPISLPVGVPVSGVAELSPQTLWKKLAHDEPPPQVIDVREPREFKRGHIPQAELLPLPQLLGWLPALPTNREVVFVCRGGRRSRRAAALLYGQGYRNVYILAGGMLAWEAAGLLEAFSPE